MKTLKVLGWGLLLVLTALMASGIRLNWLIFALSMTALLVLLLLLEFEYESRDPRKIALVGVLVALTVSSRQLLHGVEFSPVFFLTILSGHVFGFTVGFAVGALTMFTSNFFLGHGPWTPFQMLGLGLTGALAAFLPKNKRFRRPLLIAYSVLTAYSYGVFTDMFSWIAFIPTHTLESFLAMVVAGMGANTVRAIGNIFFMTIFAPTMLKILERFRKRLS
jgi:energy-coupling factor transport system substrate-specific component